MLLLDLAAKRAWWLPPRSWGASTPMKMCDQAVFDNPGALRHMYKNNSKRPVWIMHPLAPIRLLFFLFSTLNGL